MFFVYIDWTLEEPSRAFYVGKGTRIRVGKRERNEYWKSIRDKYGWRREVILATKDEDYAFEQEEVYIAHYGTFENGVSGRWGANLTPGGGGVSGRDPWNKGLKTGPLKSPRIGRQQSLESRQKIAASLRNRKKSPEHIAKVAETVRQRVTDPIKRAAMSAKITAQLTGRKASESTRQKLRDAWKRRKERNEGCDSGRGDRLKTSTADTSAQQVDASARSSNDH